MAKFTLLPFEVNPTVAGREPNSTYRVREYLTGDEVEGLKKGARGNR
jgi:hypothetical protein